LSRGAAAPSTPASDIRFAQSDFLRSRGLEKDVKGIVVLNGVIFASLVGLGYLFMTMFGVVGVGYAWIVANGVGCVCVGAMVWGEGVGSRLGGRARLRVLT